MPNLTECLLISTMYMYSVDTTVAKTTIFYLPSGARVMIVRTFITPHKVFTFHHSISHPLREQEEWSHDANVTMVMEVAQQVSNTDFQLEFTAKPS